MTPEEQARAIEWAEARRGRLRKLIDELGSRIGAEGYLDDVTEVDLIAKRHGFLLIEMPKEQP